MITRVALAALALATLGAAPPPSTCTGDPRIAAAADAWTARREQPPLALPLEHATCFRDALLVRIRPSLGPVIGYKVGAYTKAARATFGTQEPAVGVLRRGMMLPKGAPVPARYGFAPVAEADLLLVVRDAGINRAETREDIYRHLRGWRPFVELPDNHYPASVTPDFARLTALDVNARAGVMASEVPLAPGPAGAAALAGLTAEIAVATPSGVERRSVRISEVLGDPVEIVRAARDLLRREGKSLRAGDVISLGSLGPAHVPTPGERFRIDYTVGTRIAGITVTFS